jgi:glutaminyl-peptide cyclotransferase
MKHLLGFTALAFVMSCNSNPEPPEESVVNNVPEPATISYNIVNVYPHDTSSYTQGLQWYDGFLYEGTGLEGQSHLMKINLKDGQPIQKISIDKSLFGEGITIINNKIYQLTWKNNKVFVYDLATLKKLKEFHWDHDGWGLTNNGKELLISTGGNNIYFVDPETFRILNTISVNSNYGPLGDINELEYVNGKIYANIYGSDYIAVINPETGSVEAKLDFTGLLQKSGKTYENSDVLNGIAYDSTKNSFYITGKKWPALFEVKLNQ